MTTSDARKRLAEFNDPHAGCIRGLCRAGNHHQAVRCDEPAAPQSTASVVCTNCDADDLGCTACGAHGTVAAQRPEGVTVTEWGSASDRRDVAAWLIREADQRLKFFPQRRDGVDDVMRGLAAALAAEVSGDTEAGGDR